MLASVCYAFLMRCSVQPAGPDGVLVHEGAVLEWAMLWDIYLSYLGGGDRWLAYEAFFDGLTVRGRRYDFWAQLTGEQIVGTLAGASLTPEVLIANQQFSPEYGVDRYSKSFESVIG